ncbi:hypothetical protein [Wielerella bovis]|uniref:hypothetical protein n=1 Tax=Wielerella bovis TaxID=2917790 RepID=UPI00201920AB|nr:hypothetical protein [Wielerella bovis]ULJ65910.1 hypothetical protein MIS33_01140 [Wielerella bovis]ULJ68305.1 hypothetical protein MIS31_01145 [Wielerella bovis]
MLILFLATLLHKHFYFFHKGLNSIKNKFAALIAATFVATPVMAQDFDKQVFANQNVKAIELSQTEMQETQGEWVANVVGGVSAGAGYLLGGGKDPYKFMGQVGLGTEQVAL